MVAATDRRGWAPRLLLAVTLGVSCGAATADPAPPAASILLRGFATLGVARFSDAQTGVVSEYRQRKPVADDWSVDLDSVVGGQVEWRLGAHDQLVGQVVARAGRGWRAEPSLAFWQHAWDDGWRLRLGRQASPIFRDSEIHNIGYAGIAMRPPLPVYSRINALSSFDGGEIAWRGDIGPLDADFSVHAGETRYRHRPYRNNVQDIDIAIRDMRTFAASLRHGGWSARLAKTFVGRYEAHSSAIEAMDAGIAGMAATLGQIGLGAQGATLDAWRTAHGHPPRYTSLALGWADPDWRVDAESTWSTTGSPTIGDAAAWQFTVARVFGRATPYVFVSGQTIRQPPLDAAAFAAVGIPAVDAGLAALRGGIEASRRDADMGMRSAGIGLRYDLRENVALKFQVERLRYNSVTTSVSGTPPAEGGASGLLVGAAIELVF